MRSFRALTCGDLLFSESISGCFHLIQLNQGTDYRIQEEYTQMLSVLTVKSPAVDGQSFLRRRTTESGHQLEETATGTQGRHEEKSMGLKTCRAILPAVRFILAPMALNDILAELDAEIARLQQARSLLTASGILSVSAPRRGRPKKDTAELATITVKKKRNLSPEGRARIAAAVKRRWASQKAKQKKA